LTFDFNLVIQKYIQYLIRKEELSIRKNWGNFRFFILLTLLTSLFFCTVRQDKAVVGTNGMVVSVNEYASRVGIDILKKGGNAVDAAVAVGFALAVTYPSAGNIGGGGFMIVRFPDTEEAVALDFREMAPGKATPDMYLDEKGKYVEDRSYFGHLAVGVPGTVKGFELAMEKYGSLEWEDVIGPAIKLGRVFPGFFQARRNSIRRGGYFYTGRSCWFAEIDCRTWLSSFLPRSNCGIDRSGYEEAWRLDHQGRPGKISNIRPL
jgi:hypothetical protein